MCAARLSSSGVYVPDILAGPADRRPPQADETLRVTDTWVLYVRQRTENVRLDDIARLLKKERTPKRRQACPIPASGS